ncbi:Caspase domain-containing protein [bacterium JGI 053]|nr:Caspase domain-containing protein [bacterium JGI 053]
MGNAISLHVGVGCPGEDCGTQPLKGADCDARVMREIARNAGFASTLLIGKEATLDEVTGNLDRAAHDLYAGDILLVTYSGHGNRVQDCGDGSTSPESDGLFETWCLADRQMSDVKAYTHLTKFREDVRIVVIADCCYSGGFAVLNMQEALAAARAELGTSEQFGSELIPATHELRVAAEKALLNSAPPLSIEERMFSSVLNVPRRSVYNALLPALLGKRVTASVLLLASTLDNEPAPIHQEHGGFFTMSLLDVWDGGRFSGSYPHLISEIAGKLLSQTPNFLPFGKRCPGLLHERPFSISALPCEPPPLAGASRGQSPLVLAHAIPEFH